MTRWWVAVLAALAFAPGCSSIGEAPRWERPAFRFRLGPGDALRVSVWGRPELLTEADVAPDGRFNLPLAGNVPLAGLTLEDAAERLATALKEFVRDPIVTVESREVRSSTVHVAGEVRVPGTVPYFDGLTLLAAIQRSGSWNDQFGDKNDVYICRDPLGAKKLYKADLESILTEPDGQKDVFLQPGDIVYLPPRVVTKWARWVEQALAPFNAFFGAGRNAAFTATAIPRPF